VYTSELDLIRQVIWTVDMPFESKTTHHNTHERCHTTSRLDQDTTGPRECHLSTSLDQSAFAAVVQEVQSSRRHVLEQFRHLLSI